MTPEDSKAPERFSLSRWSRRKREAARGAPVAPASASASADAAAVAPTPAGSAPLAAGAPGAAGATSTHAAESAPAVAAPPAAEALPPVDSLTFDSDFAAFMQPKVDEGTKRAALKKLFSNEHFNVMDGLDIYVGDYTQPDPMPEGMLDKLANVYEAIKPFEVAPAATDATVTPQASGEVPGADGAPQDPTPDTLSDVEATPAPPAAADELPPPNEAADATTTTAVVPAPSATPKSA